MPIYEYECEKCGRRFEFLQKVGDEPKKVCPCGEGGKLRRLISAPAIRFKGSGWYVTDYAHKNSGPSAERREGDGASGPKESGKKADKTDAGSGE